MNNPTERTRWQRWLDAVQHRGPGYDLTQTPTIPGVREVRITVHAPTDENAGQWAETIRDLVVAEYGQDMRLDITITGGQA